MDFNTFAKKFQDIFGPSLVRKLRDASAVAAGTVSPGAVRVQIASAAGNADKAGIDFGGGQAPKDSDTQQQDKQDQNAQDDYPCESVDMWDQYNKQQAAMQASGSDWISGPLYFNSFGGYSYLLDNDEESSSVPKAFTV